MSLVRRRIETRGGYISGFCSDATRVDALAGAVELRADASPDQWHGRCRGATTNGAGKTSLCVCPHHDHHPSCHECGHQYRDHSDDYDPALRRCVDRAECAARIAQAHADYVAASPLQQQLRSIQADVAAKREERAEARPTAERPRKTPKRAKGTPQRCHCGCGAVTKGGRFSMGHDMKLKGRLFEAARGAVAGRDGTGMTDAALEILARGWNTSGIVDRVMAEAVAALERAEAETGSAEAAELAVIRDAVNGRYDGVEGEVA